MVGPEEEKGSEPFLGVAARAFPANIANTDRNSRLNFFPKTFIAKRSSGLKEITYFAQLILRHRKNSSADPLLLAQGFLGAHAAIANLFNIGRHLVRAQHYRDLRIRAFAEWSRAVA